MVEDIDLPCGPYILQSKHASPPRPPETGHLGTSESSCNMFPAFELLPLLALLSSLASVYWLIWIIYTTHFHPLAKYPGPLLAHISRWWLVVDTAKGSSDRTQRKLHAKYGQTGFQTVLHVIRIDRSKAPLFALHRTKSQSLIQKR